MVSFLMDGINLRMYEFENLLRKDTFEINLTNNKSELNLTSL